MNETCLCGREPCAEFMEDGEEVDYLKCETCGDYAVECAHGAEGEK